MLQNNPQFPMRGDILPGLRPDVEGMMGRDPVCMLLRDGLHVTFFEYSPPHTRGQILATAALECALMEGERADFFFCFRIVGWTAEWASLPVLMRVADGDVQWFDGAPLKLLLVNTAHACYFDGSLHTSSVAFSQQLRILTKRFYSAGNTMSHMVGPAPLTKPFLAQHLARRITGMRLTRD